MQTVKSKLTDIKGIVEPQQPSLTPKQQRLTICNMRILYKEGLAMQLVAGNFTTDLRVRDCTAS
jgi:hypothetical protein